VNVHELSLFIVQSLPCLLTPAYKKDTADIPLTNAMIIFP